ncbi:ribonuclease J [Corynebacterium glyciniphilum]|uniref:ribonuclease J n=1 Tax=Corynebacterium glyciniphilum TaxID=1404244 RepID=UPI002650A518|nr:ribonuclease J [Corynebacterium glyciniphilum]MDN5682929.1 ribonuclease J [Corynebacterium glyciniphilum]MDN6705679.1 ribonuclease J [Corynebacterium glyciniphilum]
MTENRSRARKVTRKAAPPSADTSAADVAATFNDGGQATDSAPETNSNTGNTDAASDSGPSASSNADTNSGNNSGGGSRSRSRRSRGRGNNGGNGGNNANNAGNNQGGNSRNRGGRNQGGQGNQGNQGNQGGGNRNRGNRNNQGGDRRRNAVQTMQGADLTQRLPKPPKAPTDGLRIIALGGISEIGRNMTVFEYHNRIIIIDCGVLFPSSGEPGVDLILPDFSYLDDKWDRVEALVVTHGHEDHIGAIPWLLKQRADIPIIGSRFTCALIAAKCQEHRLRPKLIEVDDTSHESRGPFDLRFFNVGHSIPECLGIALKTGAGLLVHTGDVKLDQTPADGRPTDLPALSRFGDEGIDLFLCDSTNATTPGVSPSEAAIGPNLRRIVTEAKQRVIIASFASNVARVQMAVDAAVAAGRKVAFNGRSMIRNMEIAERLGLLTAPRGTIVSMDEASRMAPHKVVLITTGTQGEPMAALSRMARREHRQITVRPGDLIVLSSSLVPGNEEAVFGVINMLSQIGAEVITGKDAMVHTSGHGYSGELLFLYNAARPRNAMPVHGEWRHLRANRELAVSTGVARDHTVLAQNGVVVDLVNGQASVVGEIPVGNLYVDGVTMGDVGAEELEDRTAMSEGGLISVTVVIDNRTGRPLEDPQVQARGFSDASKDMMRQVAELVDNVMLDLSGQGENDPYRMAQTLRRKVGKFVKDKWKREPFIVPTVVPMTSEIVEELDPEDHVPSL